MTHLPDKVANENCQKLILDKPATTLTAAEGVKGKQSKINNGPNPRFSTQSINFFIEGCLLIKLSILICPNFLISKKTRIDPALAPIQVNKKPSQRPNAFAFATANATSGKNGRNASIKGSNMATIGPKAL